jgi:Lipocalin-like domain
MLSFAHTRRAARRSFAVGLAAGIGLAALLPTRAFAQSADDVVGMWTLVSSIAVQDGKERDQFGPNAKGMMSLDAGGRFMLTIIGADLPKFASNNRAAGTPEENKAVVGKSIAVFGTYSISVEQKMIIFRLETATFPNWNGTEQRRSILRFNRDELKYTNANASVGGPATTTWKRAK